MAEVRLIRAWLDAIALCAMVTAHGTLGGQLPDHDELLDLLEAAETAISTNINNGAALLDRLAGWETSLLHWERAIAPTDCVICKRARAVPEDMPPHYARALHAVAGAA